MTRIEQAKDRFSKGFNCSQVVFSAFASELGLDEDKALSIASGFGGGLGKAEVCGVVTGAIMAIGLKVGHCDIEDMEKKEQVKEMTALFMERFDERFEYIRCKELLGFDKTKPEELEQILEQDLLIKKCPVFVEVAISLVEEIFDTMD